MVYFCQHGNEICLHIGQGISVPDEQLSLSEGVSYLELVPSLIRRYTV